MNDARHRRDNAEIAEGPLSPFEEFIAFTVALEFHLCVAGERICGGEEIHLNGMVDDEVNRHKRVDLFRVATETCNGGAHRSEIHDCWDAGEILHNDTGWQKWNTWSFAFRCPCGDIFDVVL